MRKRHLQLGILKDEEKVTEQTRKTFNIFESHHKLVKAVQDAEKKRADRLIGS